nr:hypothetical protein BaRGS_021354 [Batillaria attramentaria]
MLLESWWLIGHVSDTSDMEQRTRRLGRILASSFLGMFVGSLLAGLLQDLSSLLITLCVVSACHALCVITVLVVVTETVSEFADEERVILRVSGTPVMTVVKTREGNKRAVIVIAILGLTLNTCLKVGDQDVTVLFVQQPPLSWPQSWYGYLIACGLRYNGHQSPFSAARPVRHATDARHLHSDAGRGLQADPDGVGGVLHGDVDGFYVSGVWSAGRTLIPGLRSVLSKTVHESEVGKLFLHPSLYGNTGQADAAEDGAYGLLLNFARPYFSLETGLSASGKESESEDQA